MFDRYRQFYQQDADLDLARKYISDNNALGFTQLYASFCSVDASPIWILYDLYVDSSARKQGVAKALMIRALALAKETGASRIDLMTAFNNKAGQHLYEKLGYRRDEQNFYSYSLQV